MPRALQKLDERHRLAARERVKGRSNGEIATLLGCRKRTVELWFMDSLVKAEVRRLSEAVEKELTTQLAAAGFAALDALVHLVTLPDRDETIDAASKQRAAEAILDRVAGLARVEVQAAVHAAEASVRDRDRQSFVRVFEGMSDEDLAAYLNGWRSGEVDGARASDPDQLGAGAE